METLKNSTIRLPLVSRRTEQICFGLLCAFATVTMLGILSGNQIIPPTYNVGFGDENSLTCITNKSLYNVTNITAPAVYIKFKGGLGNQLFQYACHYALARKNGWPLYLVVPKDIWEATRIRSFSPFDREFALDFFKVPLHEWNVVNGTVQPVKLTEVNDSALLSGLYPVDRVLTLRPPDFCLSELYFLPFKQEILRLFTPKVIPDSPYVVSWLKLILSVEESVAVHIRRGDYVRINWTSPIASQKAAMDKMADLLDKSPTFFLFTDDPDFVKKEFRKLLDIDGSPFPFNGTYLAMEDYRRYKIYLVSGSGLTSLEEFYLMTRVKHNIIPSSTFSWWAAYLNPNPNKIVIAGHYPRHLKISPNPFLNTMLFHIFYPTNWITYDPFP